MQLKTALYRSNLPDGTGKDKIYAGLMPYSTIDTKALMQYLLQNSQVGEPAARSVIAGLTEQLITFLCNGHSVRIDGLGTFSLRMKSDVELDEKGRYRLVNPHVNKVRFTPDSELRYALSQIDFQPPMSASVSRPRLSEEQAEALALQMLSEQPYFLAAQFAERASVSASTAHRHLAKLVSRGILATSGSARQILYVKGA